MKLRLSAAALFASLALGLGMSGSANATAATGVAGAARTAVAADAAAGSAAVQHVNHRHWHQRKWKQRRHHWDQRRYRPRSGIYFHFGTPYYDQPYYHAPRRVYRLSHAHYRWCEARYRSYRASDNTFNPGKGKPRRQCISPYS